jgi:hypothetical protein
MTAGQQAATYGAGGKTYNVTIGVSGTVYGHMADLGFGAITPSAYGAATIYRCTSTAGTDDFSIAMSPAELPQNYFSKVVVRDYAGNWRTFNAADARFLSYITQWYWGTGSAPVWNNVGASQLILYPAK